MSRTKFYLKISRIKLLLQSQNRQKNSRGEKNKTPSRHQMWLYFTTGVAKIWVYLKEIFVSIYAFWDFYKDFQIKKICGLIRLEKIIHQLSTTVSRVYQMFGGYSYATCRRIIMLKLTFYLWNIALNFLDLKLQNWWYLKSKITTL